MRFRLFHLICSIGFMVQCAAALADPPTRVGRISNIQGFVTLRQTGDGDAQAAALNWPITSGHELITDRDAFAELTVGAAALRIAGGSDLEVLQLDDRHIRLQLYSGSVQLQVRSANLAREFEIDTPQGHLLFSEPTTVRIDSRNDRFVTAINVLAGSVSFDGGNNRFAVSAGRRAEVDATGLRVMESRNNVRNDNFDMWTAARDRELQQAALRNASHNSARYVSSDMTGYEVLDSYGSWRTTSTYGAVWSPTFIPTGWAPYRDGRWTWIAPWGWTWVDNSPWGYAPSHYGRWMFYEQRWCWTPGVVSAPVVWAPALVGWVGGPNWQVAAYSGGPSVGWFPLAPREAYIPAYQATPLYVQQINNIVVINNNYSNGTIQNNRYADPRTVAYQNQSVRNAITTLPSYQFGESKTVVVAPVTARADQRRASAMPATLMSGSIAATAPAISAPAAPTYRQLRSQASSGPTTQFDRANGAVVVGRPIPQIAHSQPIPKTTPAPQLRPRLQAPAAVPMTAPMTAPTNVQMTAPSPVRTVELAPASSRTLTTLVTRGDPAVPAPAQGHPRNMQMRRSTVLIKPQ